MQLSEQLELRIPKRQVKVKTIHVTIFVSIQIYQEQILLACSRHRNTVRLIATALNNNLFSVTSI